MVMNVVTIYLHHSSWLESLKRLAMWPLNPPSLFSQVSFTASMHPQSFSVEVCVIDKNDNVPMFLQESMRGTVQLGLLKGERVQQRYIMRPSSFFLLRVCISPVIFYITTIPVIQINIQSIRRDVEGADNKTITAKELRRIHVLKIQTVKHLKWPPLLYWHLQEQRPEQKIPWVGESARGRL